MTRRRRAPGGRSAEPQTTEPAVEPEKQRAEQDPEPAAAPPAAQAEASATSAPRTDPSAADRSGLPVTAATERLADDIYRVQLGVFEGPLDLLLHLIQKHELDIFDIPVSFVTKKYLEYLELMRSLQIDVASEYLVMAATLAHIKSQMLLPEPPSQLGDGEEGAEPPDPRAELVRRLLEYQKYRDAAARLAQQPVLGRDVFGRGPSEPEAEGPATFAQISVFKLFEVFDQVLKRAGRQVAHEVTFDRISITERIVELTELLHDRGRVRFEDFLLGGEHGDSVTATPFALVITFMAMLEMCRLGVARITQMDDSLGEIYVEFSARGSRLPARPPAPVPAAPEATLPTSEELEQEALGEESFEEWLARRAESGDDEEAAADSPEAIDALAALEALDDPGALAGLDELGHLGLLAVDAPAADAPAADAPEGDTNDSGAPEVDRPAVEAPADAVDVEPAAHAAEEGSEPPTLMTDDLAHDPEPPSGPEEQVP